MRDLTLSEIFAKIKELEEVKEQNEVLKTLVTKLIEQNEILLKSEKTTNKLKERLYTESQVARKLNVGTETIARKRKAGLIKPSIWESKIIRYTQEDIENYQLRAQPEKLNPKIKI